MSDNDAFDRAVRALRETAETSAADVARTRARVLETLHRGERRGRRTLWALLPIAAVLAGGAAFAKNSDAVRHAWTGVAEAVGIGAPAQESPRPAPAVNRSRASVQVPTNAVPTEATAESGARAETVAPAESAAPVEAVIA